MKPKYVYPASFCPPTFGHLYIVARAAELFPELILICSRNPEKNHVWFTPEENKRLWATYELPPNVKVKTFEELSASHLDMSSIIMVRGVRDGNDAKYEKKVMLFNRENFGITKYVYLFCDPAYKHISSSSTRKFADGLELEKLAEYVSPLVISALLEKVLNIRHLFMVVGKPGTGKSTFLKTLEKENVNNVHINTDDFNHHLRPLLEKNFGQADLIQIAMTKEAEMTKLIAEPWMNLLRKALRSQPQGSNVFVEVPFGMQPNKKMFRFLGGKVIYVGCDKQESERRLTNRSTPRLKPFVEQIPGYVQTKKMAKKYMLCLLVSQTNGPTSSLQKHAQRFSRWLNKEDNKWKTFLPGSCLDI